MSGVIVERGTSDVSSRSSDDCRNACRLRGGRYSSAADAMGEWQRTLPGVRPIRIRVVLPGRHLRPQQLSVGGVLRIMLGMIHAEHHVALVIAVLAALTVPRAVEGAEHAIDPDPWSQCEQAIAAAERIVGVPPRLLKAIALAESGRPREGSKGVQPWPWTVTAEGRGRFLATKTEALAVIETLQDRNIRNIDVGCMQVNLHHHPAAFASLDEALDPASNAHYAAHFLHGLFRQSGSWGNAVARYHASIYGWNLQYRNRVMRIWHSLRTR